VKSEIPWCVRTTYGRAQVEATGRESGHMTDRGRAYAQLNTQMKYCRVGCGTAPKRLPLHVGTEQTLQLRMLVLMHECFIEMSLEAIANLPKRR
jgi:hypothetical protein